MRTVLTVVLQVTVVTVFVTKGGFGFPLHYLLFVSLEDGQERIE